MLCMNRSVKTRLQSIILQLHDYSFKIRINKVKASVNEMKKLINVTEVYVYAISSPYTRPA